MTATRLRTVILGACSVSVLLQAKQGVVVPTVAAVGVENGKKLRGVREGVLPRMLKENLVDRTDAWLRPFQPLAEKAGVQLLPVADHVKAFVTKAVDYWWANDVFNFGNTPHAHVDE